MATLARIIQLNSIRSTFYKSLRSLSTQNISNPTVTNAINPWIWQGNNTNLQLPHINKYNINLPSGIIWTPFIQETDKVVDLPSDSNADNAKQAAKLIVIRRKKMKKHKLQKLRKRMKFEWAKLRQKRELRKEKEFQAGLIKQCKVAEEFNAENYVNEKLSKLNEIIIPKYWKGKRLQEFLIREKMGLPPK